MRARTSVCCHPRPRRVASWRSKRWRLALRSWRLMPAASARALPRGAAASWLLRTMRPDLPRRYSLLSSRREPRAAATVCGCGGPHRRRGLYTDGSAGRGGGLMRWLTHLGGARVTIGIGLGLIAVGEQLLGLAALFALTTSHMAVQVLKRAVAHPRPCDASGRPLALIDLPDPFSFPSGHAAAASAVGGTIAIAHPALAPVLLPLAALIAGSRVSLRVHPIGAALLILR